MQYLKLLIIITLSLASQYGLIAQYTDLTKDKNVSWIAEIETNYSFEMAQTSRTEMINWVYPVKFTQNKASVFQNNVSIDTTLFWQSFIDSSCLIKGKGVYIDSIQYSGDSLIHSCRCLLNYGSYQIIASIDVKSHNISPTVVHNKRLLYHYSHFRVRQILYYDYKRKQFRTRAIAVMPIFKHNRDGLGEKEVETYWINIYGKQKKSKLNIQSKDINYAIKTVTRFENNINIEQLKVVKNTRNHPQLNEWIVQLVNSKKQKIYDSGNDEMMNPTQIQAVFTQTDSTQVFNPETNELKVIVHQKGLKAENIKAIKLYQTWGIDKKRYQLYSDLTGLAPVETIFFNGIIRYERPIFIIASK